MRIVAVFSLALSAAFAQRFPPSAEVPAGPAEAVYFNGRVVTMNPAAPRASAVAVAGGRVLAVGSLAEAERVAGPATRRIDLNGRMLLPGLIDSHVHPISAALAERGGEIPVMRGFADLRAHVEREIGRGGEGVIVVPKVYSTRLEQRRYPTRWQIDEYSGERAVVLDNGYAAALNSEALRRAGVSKETPDPADGKIIRREDGEPTGLILGARRLVAPLLSERSWEFEDEVDALRRMQQAYNRAGLTSVIDRSLNPRRLRVYGRLWRRGELTVRSYLTRTVDAERPLEEIAAEIRAIGFASGFGDEMMRLGSLKIFLDGGILIGTAYLRAPYGEHTEVYGFDDPDYRGVLRVPPATIAAVAELCARSGLQMTAHTTGGGSTDALLDAYERADRAVSIRDRRFTLTHANFLTPEAIARAARLGVVMDLQPAWHHFDGPALSRVLGPARMRTFQPYKSIFDAGVVVAGGSDHMIKFDSKEAINPYDPFYGMWMVVTRRATDGRVYNPEQRLTREQALKMWTLNAAYLSFEEGVKGSIEPGKYADFVVIDRDLFECAEDEIQDIRALRTILGGRTVYDSDEPL